ncbi:TPA: hypothetical protein ACUMCM_001429 [Haemophilus influenzae]
MGFSPPKYLTIVCWWAEAHPTITKEIYAVDKRVIKNCILMILKYGLQTKVRSK